MLKALPAVAARCSCWSSTSCCWSSVASSKGTTIILVILPVLLPTASARASTWCTFGVVAVVNIMFGLITPPYGLLLFMMTKIADVPLRDIVREVMPFLYVMIGALALIAFVPGLVLWLPRMMGYKG